MTIESAKHTCDAVSGLNGFACYFKMVPWPEIAAMLTVVWYLYRFYDTWISKRRE